MQPDLKNLLSSTALSRKEKILILLAAEPEPVKTVGRIRDLAISNGLREAQKWNISQVLKSLGGAAISLPTGWELTDEGRSFLIKLGVINVNAAPSKALQPTLRKYANGILAPTIREFVDEAIGALELKLFRAAVVLSWVGAISVLYEVVLTKYLTDFNAEACKRFPKWKQAKTADDLSHMKEYDFLQVLQAISVFGKNTKDELEQCLKLRNTCGHPNSHKLGEHRVTSHVETLVLNIFSKYVI